MAGRSAGKSSGGARKGGPERRIVSPVKGGGYRIDKPGGKRASGTADTKKEAGDKAKRMVRNAGGGEVTFRDKAGRIENSNTIKPGNDPFPPRDKRH